MYNLNQRFVLLILFLTGGTGYFGIWLVEGLLALNQERQLGMKIAVLSRRPELFAQKMPHLANRPELEFVSGDVRTFTQSSWCENQRFDAIIHAATDTVCAPGMEAALDRLDTIVEGTRRVLEFAVKSGAKRILNISSGAVYGKQPREMTHVKEEYLGGPDPLSPTLTYGEGKRIAEHLGVIFAQLNPALQMTIARGFAFHGAHLPLDQHFAAGNFLRDATAGGPIRIQGDGTPMRSYLYGADLVIWLLQILYKGRSCVAYNLGSDIDYSIADVARLTARALDLPESCVEIAKTPVAGVLPDRYVPDVTRARTELDLQVWVPFEEQVRRTAQWWKQQG